jgi:hypothetical protein
MKEQVPSTGNTLGHTFNDFADGNLRRAVQIPNGNEQEMLGV